MCTESYIYIYIYIYIQLYIYVYIFVTGFNEFVYWGF